MIRFDLWRGGQVGNGLSNFDDLEIAAGGEVQILGSFGKQVLGVWREPEVLFDVV